MEYDQLMAEQINNIQIENGPGWRTCVTDELREHLGPVLSKKTGRVLCQERTSFGSGEDASHFIFGNHYQSSKINR